MVFQVIPKNLILVCEYTEILTILSLIMMNTLHKDKIGNGEQAKDLLFLIFFI